MPKVSVIVPVYNTEKYLEKCLMSLAKQSLQDIEIIVVNDGSTDGSQNIIESFIKKYPDKFILVNKKNGGLSDARNYGMQYAKGEFLSFVDSDDYIDDSCLEEMYKKAKENNLELIECDFIWEFPEKSKIDIGREYKTKEDYFIFGRVLACNKLFKTDIIKQNDLKFPNGMRYEDIEFFYKYISFIKKSGIVQKPFYHYVQRDSSIINVQNEKTEDIFKVLQNVVDFYKERGLFETNFENLEYLYIRLLLGSSFLRMVRIPDKKTRNRLLDKTICTLYGTFPNWRKNRFLKVKSKKNIYYKTVNKFTYKIYKEIFRIIK